jgi:membrane associated rhomboid family serine protease
MAYRSPSGFSFGIQLSPAVKMIMLWNGILFLLQQIVGATLTYYLGLVPGLVAKGFLWQPVTYMFLHGGFVHLLFNMFALWMFGSELEYLWGTRRWVRYYFITGIGAGVTTLIATWVAYALKIGNPLMMGIPTVGASGAIYGLLLAFGLTFPNRRIYLYFLFPIPARLFVLIFGAIEFISSFQFASDGIAHFAHLGGMLIGYILLRGWPGQGLLRSWERRRRSRRFRIVEPDDQERRKGNRP